VVKLHPYRIGRSLDGLTIYRQMGESAASTDQFVAFFYNPMIGRRVVKLLNRDLEMAQQLPRGSEGRGQL
jgi:hypothetical protein